MTTQFVTGRLVSVNGVVRVVSWNLAFGKPGAYKSYSNRRRQWALLGALAPDIALLQECRPSDLQDHAPGWMAEEYSVAGTLQPGWKLCSTILVRKPHTVVVLDRALLGDDQRRWLDHMSGYVATATVFVGTCAMAVASVHALAEEVKVSAAVALADHERICRSGLDRAMHNDLAVAALGPWVAGRRFIVGGDWNDSPLFDVNYPKGANGVPGASTEFFERRTAAGWLDAMRKFHAEELRTYLEPKSAPYELDHVFTDAETRVGLVACEVLNNIAVAGLSDHAPVVVEFAL